MKDKYWEKDLSFILKDMLNVAETKLTGNSVDDFEIKKDIAEKYAHMINLWGHTGYGDIMPFYDFVQCVECGYISDYDGCGEFIHNDTGDGLGDVECDVEWLNKNKPENSDYVMWYNK